MFSAMGTVDSPFFFHGQIVTFHSNVSTHPGTLNNRNEGSTKEQSLTLNFPTNAAMNH